MSSQGLLTLMMQSTACMALHAVNERCCRWLLIAHDRVGCDQFEISHELLAMMLGSTRPTVTTVAGALQKARLIRYVLSARDAGSSPAPAAFTTHVHGADRRH